MGTPSRARDVLIAEVREAFGRVVYTHKTHEKDADRQMAIDNRIRWLQLILSVSTTGGLVGVLVTDKLSLEIVSAVVAACLSFLTAFAKNFRPGERAKEHQGMGHKLWIVREKYVSLLSDLEGEAVALESARARRDELQSALSEIYKDAPRTTSKSYKKAQEALQIKEDLTFHDDEIDRFLPAPLRKHVKQNTNQQ